MTNPPPPDNSPPDGAAPSNPPGPTPPPPGWAAPPASARERVRSAYARRAESDYVFTGPGMNVVLTILTCGLFGLYLFYQLMRRDRDHLRRRYDLLDAANTYAWEQAEARGLADELRPVFERNATQLATMQRQTTEFRDPVIWVVIAVLASGLAQIVGFVFIDQDLDTHDRTEGALETDLATIYERLGWSLPVPDPVRVKGKHSYVGRIVATILTCGIYQLWWLYDMQVEGNRHVEGNWPFDDALAGAVDALAAA
ncbi:MAG TPA: hypothetical protein VMX12_04510 [Acidimicrobiia bacterium]|nr:hypothetical protein [Acidimicrobiia bacterium]